MKQLTKNTVDPERWHTLTLMEQLGNIGSEVGRAANYVREGQNDRRDRALDRAFELFDLTLADNRWAGAKRFEIGRAREVCADTFYGDREYSSTPESLEKYLYHFAVAARAGR